MLQIVYFCDDSKSEHPKSPVKDYVERIIQASIQFQKKGKPKQAEKFKKLALRLLAAIKHAAENKGVVHPPLGDKMRGFPFFELRQKFGKQLVRLFYFAYHKEKLVLLHAYDKKEGTKARRDRNSPYKLSIISF